jgi:hypothetical protein
VGARVPAGITQFAAVHAIHPLWKAAVRVKQNGVYQEAIQDSPKTPCDRLRSARS